ncbi:hypothetical protein ACFYOV_03345 [Streptomyces sp. NPDC005931]|uniref:hypothetical protein n=1 Tax=Streptomyces sp. NPDC005931 TaxID=3364737 RepID=UPI00369896C6
MRRTVRPLTGTAFAVTAAGLLAAGATGLLAVPAYAGEADAPAVRPAGPPDGSLEVYPSSVEPGGQVTVNTAACGPGGTAAGDATAVGAGRFTLAPSAHEQDVIGRFRVPPGAHPGTYEIVATCDGGGRRVTGDLVVTLTPPSLPPHDSQQVYPRGSVKTGVGGALGPDPVQTAAGVTALAVAAAGGTWLLHRRARGDGI